jgi:cbb3-type cytochrome oxidase maturation protein
MNIIFLLIPVSILIAAAFLAAFIWAVKSGQYEDTLTPSMRMLLEDGSAPRSSCAHPHPDPLPEGKGESSASLWTSRGTSSTPKAEYLSPSPWGEGDSGANCAAAPMSSCALVSTTARRTRSDAPDLVADESERRSPTRPVQSVPPSRVGDRRSMSVSLSQPSES